jgi:hypothetical protein
VQEKLHYASFGTMWIPETVWSRSTKNCRPRTKSDLGFDEESGATEWHRDRPTMPAATARLDIRLIMGNSDIEAKAESHPPWLNSGRDVSSPLGKVTNIDVDINCLLRLMKRITAVE